MKNNENQVSAKPYFFCFLLCLMIFLAGCTKKEIKNIASQGLNIICYGDSITFGYGAGQGEDFPSLLAKLAKLPVINVGIDGDTTSEGLKRIYSDVLDRDPFLVIVEFCGNDFLRKVPMEETVKNITEMIDKIEAKGAMVALVDISAGLLLQDYRKQFSKIARQKNVIFIPGILSGIVTNPSLKSDFLHPNADGYNMIAQKIYRAILPYLHKNKLARIAKK
jgi:acyl-CoA thioesterase I